LPENVTVVDVCCGDCSLSSFLRKKNIDYLGIDLNHKFIKDAIKRGIKAKNFNVQDQLIPAADYIIIQDSLYQFIPHHRQMIEKLFSAAKVGVIISEPVLNVASSRNRLFVFLAKLTTKVDGHEFPYRFTKENLLDLFNEYKVGSIKEIKGGRDLIGVFIKNKKS
jgi:trans-aconitate methyltransferase